MEHPTMTDCKNLPAAVARLRRLFLCVALVLPLAPGASALAQGTALKIEGAWVRASVPGQSGTGGFMRLTASEPLTLVGLQTPAAGVAELHEMKMDGDVMRMRAVSEIVLVPGKPFDLRPGGHHLMLMGLKAPLKEGSTVPVTLVLRDARGAERRLPVQMPVALRAPGAAASSSGSSPVGAHQHGHKH
jgi:copper(I)-binding protein